MIDGRRPAGVQRLISESWRRSLRAGVDADLRSTPLVWDRDKIADARSAHPLARHLAMLRGTLREVANETAHLMVIADAGGRILWSEGAPRRAAAGRRGRSR